MRIACFLWPMHAGALRLSSCRLNWPALQLRLITACTGIFCVQDGPSYSSHLDSPPSWPVSGCFVNASCGEVACRDTAKKPDFYHICWTVNAWSNCAWHGTRTTTNTLEPIKASHRVLLFSESGGSMECTHFKILCSALQVLAVCLSTQVSSLSPAPGEWHANYNSDLIWPLSLPDDHCHIIEIFICSPTLVTFPVGHVTARTAINGFASSMVASGPGSSAPNTMLKPSCLLAEVSSYLPTKPYRSDNRSLLLLPCPLSTGRRKLELLETLSECFSTFCLLIRAGDVELNPGPTTRSESLLDMESLPDDPKQQMPIIFQFLKEIHARSLQSSKTHAELAADIKAAHTFVRAVFTALSQRVAALIECDVFRVEDFRDALHKERLLPDVVALGAYQINGVWAVPLNSPEATKRLAGLKELQVKGRRCLIIDPQERQQVKIKVSTQPAELCSKNV
ncbi:uncharacterized protein [Dermacentor albipictus]|uniref:uncharacterized protein n=1 Tax=Dermacentor albipictus TaxID=60249 RepID=UPI0038FBF0C3